MVGVARHFSLLNTSSPVTTGTGGVAWSFSGVHWHHHSNSVGSTPITGTWSSPWHSVVAGDKPRAPKELTLVGLSRV